MKMNLPWPFPDEEGFPSFDALEDLDEIQNLPFKESRKAFLTRKYGDMWNTQKFDHSWMRSDKSMYYWVKIERVIKKFLGKSFDDAFSYYCTLVPLYEQEKFLKEFEPYRGYYQNNYIVDDNRNIVLNPDRYINKKKPVTLYSSDYTIGYRLKAPYLRAVSFLKVARQITFLQYKQLQYPTDWVRIRTGATQDCYEPIVVQGKEFVYENKHVNEYVRVIRTLAIKRKHDQKALKKYNRTKALCFLTDDELQKRKDRIEGIEIRDRHGFDDNSFKGDPYHGQQRKNK